MRIAILQPNYIPWLGYFEMMHNCDLFVILDDVQYNKKFWRNRNRIRVKDGCIWLTVPVLTKDRFHQLLSETEVNSTIPWQRKHLHSIFFNYNRCKYFGQYYHKLEEILDRDWHYLVDLSIELIKFLAYSLGINTPLLRSSSLNIDQKGENKIIAICKKIEAGELYDTKNSQKFININTFSKHGIKIIFQDYNHPVYPQQYNPFIPYMSVIDLLFNCGSKSLDILLSRI